MPAWVGGWDKAISGGREVEEEDMWKPQEMGMQRDRKGCQRSSAAELGMRLRDWIWGNRGDKQIKEWNKGSGELRRLLDVGDVRAVDTCQGQLLTENGTSPKEEDSPQSQPLSNSPAAWGFSQCLPATWAFHTLILILLFCTQNKPSTSLNERNQRKLLLIAMSALTSVSQGVLLNHTLVTEFLLLGVTDIEELNPVLFVTFLTMYFVNVAGNGAILTIVILDPRLHSPMYFFLGNLACLDICYSTVTVPKMLENFLSTSKAISFLGCITQLHFFHFLGSTEALLLTVMAFDRFMAICKPLHYSFIMNRQVCIQMAFTIWAIPFLHALLHSIMTSRLNFCGSNHIHHFFCDVKPLLELACGNTELNRWLLNTLTGTIAIGLFFLTFLSYFYIITHLFLKTRSCSMLHKALSTCASHFMVVVIFYAPVLYIYISPASGSSLEEDRIIAVMYTVVTPALNPLIYSLRNKEVRGAFNRKIRIQL
ncbi:olfactory receptor 12D2-like [Arvicola amphibius]|uniref:olfactory receptor 12D2-like n=1 Tax=Arvicola amphibius TaxID=1047088 RepID=UPI001C07FE38|nr:olfactory receptor 12D2-like [Arvicola amphibius]